MVQYIQVVQRSPYDSDGLNYWYRLRPGINVTFVVISLLRFGCGFAALGQMWKVRGVYATLANVGGSVMSLLAEIRVLEARFFPFLFNRRDGRVV
jgi:hypothetical protein